MRVIIELRSSPDHSRQINHLAERQSFGEGHRVTGRVLQGTGAYQRVRRPAQALEMTGGRYPRVPAEQESVVPPRSPLCHEAIGSIRDAVEPQGLQAIALAVAEARSVDLVLQRIVDGLAGQPGIALARIWLIAPGDICSSCLVRAECPDQTHCLHLLASAGRSVLDPGDVRHRQRTDRRGPVRVCESQDGAGRIVDERLLPAWLRGRDRLNNVPL